MKKELLITNCSNYNDQFKSFYIYVRFKHFNVNDFYKLHLR